MKESFNFISRLLDRVPELKPAYDEHLRDNDELLPHVFMGDVTRFAVDQALVKEGEHLVQLLAYFEDALQNPSDEIRNLVTVSFLENLIGEDKALERIRPLMGPKLLKSFCELIA